MIALYDKEYFDEMDAYARHGRRLKKSKTTLDSIGAKRVLDVGCGHGYLVKFLLSQKYEVYGIDFSPYAGGLIPSDRFLSIDARKRLPFKDKEFDAVISTDFLEHLSVEELPNVVKEMERVGKKVLARVSHKLEHRNTGENTHLTIRRSSWWREQFPFILFF